MKEDKSIRKIIFFIIILFLNVELLFSQTVEYLSTAISYSTKLPFEDSPSRQRFKSQQKSSFFGNQLVLPVDQLLETSYGDFMRNMGFVNENNELDKFQLWDLLTGYVEELGNEGGRGAVLIVWNGMSGGYNWSDIDERFTYLYNRSQPINFVPNLSTRGILNGTYPENPEAFSDFVRALVERYDGDGYEDVNENVAVKCWQVGNEPGFAPGEWIGTAAEYAAFVKLVYDAAKEADPDCKIIFGAPLQPHDYSFSYEKQQASVEFTKEAIASLGGVPAFDVLDIHDYPNKDGWKTSLITEMRQFLDDNGYPEVEIWMMEHGTWTGDPDGANPTYQYQSEEDQARFLIKTFVYNRDLGASKMFWSQIVERGFFLDAKFTAMGLVYDGLNGDPEPQNTKKPSFNSYKMLAENTDTDAATYVGKMEIYSEEKDLYGYKYQDRITGDYFCILWTEVGEQTVTFSVNIPTVHVTNMITQEEYDELASEGEVTITIDQNPVFVKELSTTSVEEEPNFFVPSDFKLEQNYPNPFNPQTTIEYHLPKSGHIILRIYNLLGQVVKTLVGEHQPVGSYSVVWDGKDHQGRDVASGIYFYQLTVKEAPFKETKKLLLLR